MVIETADVPWEKWRHEVAESLSIEELRSRLGAVAHTMSDLLPRGKVARSQWESIGVRVLKSDDLSSDGACMYSPRSSIVLVRKENGYRRQRFTTAHEIAHLLLGRVRDAGRVDLNWKQEEALCDEFAANLLIPAAELKKRWLKDGGVVCPDTVLEIAHEFAVNVRPVTLALARSWSNERQLLIAAERRGHPLRPDEIDYRISGSAGYPYEFVPLHQRLRSIGLDTLADWAEHGSTGDPAKGRVAALKLKFGTRLGTDGAGPRTGTLLGEASWSAIAVNNRQLVLALLDLVDTTIRWSKRRAG